MYCRKEVEKIILIVLKLERGGERYLYILTSFEFGDVSPDHIVADNADFFYVAENKIIDSALC